MREFDFDKNGEGEEKNPFAEWDTAKSKEDLESFDEAGNPADLSGESEDSEKLNRDTDEIGPIGEEADNTADQQNVSPEATDDAQGAEKSLVVRGEFDGFIIGKDFPLGEEDDEPENLLGPMVPEEHRRKHKKGCLSVAVWVGVILAVAISFAAGVILSMSDVLGIGKDYICQVTITEGMSTEQIANELKEQGAIKYPLLFRIYSKMKKYDGTYQYGIYGFNSNKGYDGIVEELQTMNQAKTVTVRIPERASVDDIMTLLEDNKVCTVAQFKKAMREGEYHYNFLKDIPEETVRYRLEGYLYPDTYSFFVGESDQNAQRAIEKMLNNLSNKLPKDYEKKAQKLGYSFHKVMTMASIVELEATGYPDEMGKVAAVFYNRLKWDEPKYLGSTPTYNYPDNRYNTNAPDGNNNTKDGYEGLPPGPLCSPSIGAVLGALEPEPNFKATYFVTDINFKFYYFNSYNAHINKINELKNSGKWAG